MNRGAGWHHNYQQLLSALMPGVGTHYYRLPPEDRPIGPLAVYPSKATPAVLPSERRVLSSWKANREPSGLSAHILQPFHETEGRQQSGTFVHPSSYSYVVSKASEWLIVASGCVFISMLGLSAYWEPDIRWLHFFQAWMYVATIVLAHRRNRWGYFIGFSAAGLWIYANLFATTFFFNGPVLKTLRQVGRRCPLRVRMRRCLGRRCFSGC